MGKKKRFQAETEQQHEENPLNSVSELINGEDISDEPKKKKKRKKEQQHENISDKFTPTVSIAIPSSIIGNAQSHELATRVLSLSHYPFSVSAHSRRFYCNTVSLFIYLK